MSKAKFQQKQSKLPAELSEQELDQDHYYFIQAGKNVVGSIQYIG